MAKVDPDKDGKYKLGGSKDTDLEGIDNKKYDVFTETDKLAEAQRDFPDYDWFVSFTIKDKNGHDVRDIPEYTVKFDKPDSPDSKIYYYLDRTAHLVSYEDTDNQGNKNRVKAKLSVGDPPTGQYP